MSGNELRELSAADLAELLRAGTVRFAVAHVGAPLKWIPVAESYGFWKSEVKPHLTGPAAQNRPGDFPDGYCYFATEWWPEEGEPVVLLTMQQ